MLEEGKGGEGDVEGTKEASLKERKKEERERERVRGEKGVWNDERSKDGRKREEGCEQDSGRSPSWGWGLGERRKVFVIAVFYFFQESGWFGACFSTAR